MLITWRRGIVLAVVAVPAVFLAVRAWAGRVVDVATVKRTDLVQTLVVNGRVLAPQRVSLGAVQIGAVVARLVEEGDRVRAGQELVRFDDREMQANLDQAQAKLQQVRQVGAATSRATVDQAAANLGNAESQYSRTKSLFDQGLLAANQFDDARAALAVARAAGDAARAQAVSAASGGDLRLAEAGVATARARLGQMSLLAPADGTILTRAVEVGDAVQPGKTLFTMAVDHGAEILVQPDERYLSALAPGQHAMVSADAYPGERFAAEIFYVSPAVDPQRGAVDVKLRVPAPPPFLRVDMTVSAEIEQARRSGAIAVPRAAVRDLQTTPYALVIRNHRAERTALELGVRGDREIEVLRGLAEGDVVVLDPAARPGQRVRPREAH